MAQYFNLSLDTTAPSGGSISVSAYYKQATAVTITLPTDADTKFMKVWVDQTATPTAAPTGTEWLVAATSWTPTLSVQGTNYIHAIFMDDVGNQGAVVHSSSFIYDTTAPTISAVSINDGAAMTSTVNVNVKVTAADAAAAGADVSSGIAKTTLSGSDLADDATKEFTWDDTDRTNGYKICATKLKALGTGVESETRTVSATVTDRAGNESAAGSDSIVLFTGDVTFVVDLRDPDDHTKKCGTYTNQNSWTICLDFEPDVSAELVRGYKIWGDFNSDGGATPEASSEPASWIEVTLPAGTKCIDITGKKLTSGTAAKNIYAKLLVDEGGQQVANEASTSTNYSIAVPAITMDAINPNIISDKTGFNSTAIGFTVVSGDSVTGFNKTVLRKVVGYASEAAAMAGTINDTAITGLSASDSSGIPDTTKFEGTLTEANLVAAVAGDGAKYLVVYVQDMCGNVGTCGQTVSGEHITDAKIVTVDTAGPVVTWGDPFISSPIKAAETVMVTASDTPAGMNKMKVWVDNISTITTPPSTAQEYDYSANPGTSLVDWTGVAQGTNYVHAIYSDTVGNTSQSTSGSFTFDSVAPTCTVAFASEYTSTANQTVTISGTDATTTVDYMKIWGDLVGAGTEPDTWETFATTKSVVLTEPSASSPTGTTKNIYVKVKDTAGNVSEVASDSIVYDNTNPEAKLVLKDSAGAVIPATVKDVAFKAEVGTTDTGSVDDIDQYCLWGDFTASVGDTDWKSFVKDTGKSIMTITDLAFTTGDGAKVVYLKTKDKAGNVSTTVSVTTTLDQTIPVVTVKDVDYNVISKTHEPRRTISGSTITIIEGAYGDKITFKFNCGEKIVQWKVAVFESGQEAASAVAIGEANGSINMSGTTETAASTDVACTIMGKDFAATTKVADTDGAYYVVVYVKDVAGNWSAVPVL